MDGGPWDYVARLAFADGTNPWLGEFTGAACVLPTDDSSSTAVEVLVTGRDAKNRSLIGRGRFDLADPEAGVMFEPEPVLGLGALGAFDENGVSYPCAVAHDGGLRLYYTGWMPTVITPFQNHIGAAELATGGRFERISRAPILPRTDADYLSMGSCHVGAYDDGWWMWYTSWLSWGADDDEPKHRYVIKSARSSDGLVWARDDVICIGLEGGDEHSIARPTVIRDGDGFHMWYCVRGDRYRLGYARSEDGVRWQRSDELMVLGPRQDWDGDEQCYPHVFERAGQLWMLYCGNGYGRGGLGLARYTGSLAKREEANRDQ